MQKIHSPATTVLHFFSQPRGWLILLMLFHFVMNIWWLYADNHAIRTDEETHMIMARDYYEALFPRVGNRGLIARLNALTRIKADPGNPVHPPLLHVSGAVLTRVIGYSVDRLAFTNTLAFLLALLGVYRIARLFLDERESVFTVTVFSFTPMIYMSSRYFMTDFMSMTFVVWTFYAMFRNKWFMDTRWSILFGVFNGLALMTRTTVVLYYFIPAAVAYAAGVFFLFQREKGWRINQLGLARISMNALFVVLVTLAIASPWYIVHGQRFYQHWMKPHMGGAGAPLSIVRYEESDSQGALTQSSSAPAQDTTPASRPAQPTPTAPSNATEPGADRHDQTPPEDAEAEAEAAPSPATTTDRLGRWRLLVNRRIPWTRYPVFIINNAVFLPMFLLTLVGMITLLIARRFRCQPIPWFLLLWLLGSYYLLTSVLSFSTPRYFMQALPALAFFAALPILAVPRGRVRTLLQGMFLTLLLFQYGNLTVHAYGPIADLKIPVYVDENFQKQYDDHGLYLYKSILHASSAYGRMQAPMKENYKDRLFFAMLQAEQERPYFGIEANYARCNIRGMILDEQHFWLDGNARNPFRRHDIPPELAPYRNFRHYGWGRDIDAVLPVLNIVDYVAYTTEDITEAKEQEWLQTFAEHGFELIERFHEDRFGMVHARHFGLLARRETESLPKVASVADIDSLNLTDLYKVRWSSLYPTLDPMLRSAVDNRLNMLFLQAGRPVRMNEHVDFLGASVYHSREDWYVLQLMFRCNKSIARNYRVMFQGVVTPEYMASHFGNRSGKHGQFRWNFDPSPITRLWPENEFVLLRFPVGVRQVPYRMSFGFYTAATGVWGDAVSLGDIDFGEIPRKAEN